MTDLLALPAFTWGVLFGVSATVIVAATVNGLARVLDRRERRNLNKGPVDSWDLHG